MELIGRSIIGGAAVAPDEQLDTFRASDPATGKELEPAFQCARQEDVERAAALADDVVRCYGPTSGVERAALLRRARSGEQIR